MNINKGGGKAHIDSAMVEKAQTLYPNLITEIIYPKKIVEMVEDKEVFQGWDVVTQSDYSECSNKTLGKDDEFIFDFGDHTVGYMSLSIKPEGSPPDAPLRIKLIFGEMPCEIGESFDSYQGWLSSSWLQEEVMTVDTLPCELKLPRRYTFRYVKLKVLDTSPKYRVSIQDIHCTTVTSGDVNNIEPLSDEESDEINKLDAVAIKTLKHCMQTVFEDGPKRDRRLWLGDLRLQAQANYLTFNNNDLVKRCLYLFAGMTLDEGRVGACVFEKPEPLVDDTLLYDYSLFFTATLYDYYQATNDKAVLAELWPTAMKQLEYGVSQLNHNGIVKDDDTWWCFIDWHSELNKQTPAQAILIYCLKRGLKLAKELNLYEEQQFINKHIDMAAQAAVTKLWDKQLGFFTSGSNKQVSWASQIWMVLAEVFDTAKNTKLMKRLLAEAPTVAPVTPYMYHHLVEALFVCGMREKAQEQLQSYWGGMIADGADTFWELYNPSDKAMSPYGSNLINSYCHAWSCTPTYFIRKYNLK
jgi:alpha-L-rhamnosidase